MDAHDSYGRIEMKSKNGHLLAFLGHGKNTIKKTSIYEATPLKKEVQIPHLCLDP